MAKKTGRLILFGIIAGATAAGVYHYLQNKNNNIEEFDDFDDLDDDFDEIDYNVPLGDIFTGDIDYSNIKKDGFIIKKWL